MASEAQQAAEALLACRVKLLMKFPFYGNVAMRFVFVEASDWLDTMATDGLRLYYNSGFVLGMKPKERLFVLCHEVMHVVYEHMTRRGKREARRFNMAADYTINADLIYEKVGEMPTRIEIRKGKATEQRVGLYKPKYHGWTTEEIYDDLEKNKVEIEIGFDDHLEVEKEENTGKSSLRMPDGRGQVPKEQQPDDLGDLHDQIREAVLEAAAAAAGTLPKSVERLINDLTNPKLDWRELLNSHLQSVRRADYSFTVPARKTFSQGIVLPGLTRLERLELAVALDCSGSVNDDMIVSFLTELRSILDSFEDYSVHIFCFGTQVAMPIEITPDTADDLLSYKPKNLGGTAFECIFEFIEAEGLSAERLVVFTDGLPCKGWGNPNLIETLWILYGTHTIKPPFGSWVYYD